MYNVIKEVNIMAVKVRGKVVTTERENQEILSDGNEGTIESITNVQVQNMGEGEINVVFNDGDKILIRANETLSLGNVVIESIVVVESGSKVRYIGLN